MTWSNSTASVLQVQTLIVGGSTGGVFIYNGTPATGNLIGSWAGAAGTDAFGNPYPQGLNVAGGDLAAFAGPTNSTTILTADVFADAFARFIVNADGTLGWGPGTTPTDTNLFRSSAGTLHTDDIFNANGGVGAFGPGLTVGTAGGKVSIKEGTNAAMGTAVLSAGLATVNTTAVSANSRILLTAQSPGGTAGALRVNTRTAGTSFQIASTSTTDTSTVAWVILEPA